MKHYLVLTGLTACVIVWGWGCGKSHKMAAADYFAAADSLIQKGKYDEAIQTLEGVSKLIPSDTANMIKAGILVADVYGAHLNNYPKAIESLQRIVDTYPTEPLAATCLFKIGFTYETETKDMAKARQTYEEFLKKYPAHELATSVRLSLEHLGESDDELLERILKKNELGTAKGK
jgi:TolA-binding protein